MAIVVWERRGSGTTASGINAAGERLYCAKGSDDEVAILAAVRAASPLSISTDIGAGSLGRNTIRVEPKGPDLWYAVVSYAPWRYQLPQAEGEVRVSMRMGGGTQHITQSLATVASYRRGGGSAPSFDGAIGVSRDRVEGVDIVVPSAQLSVTKVIKNSGYTNAVQRTILGLVGTVNDSSFRSWAAGEALFYGCDSSQRGTGSSDLVELCFTFMLSPNRGGFSVGDVNVSGGKRGHEYLWVRYEDAEDEDVLIQRPASAYVEKVYQYGDFDVLGVG